MLLFDIGCHCPSQACCMFAKYHIWTVWQVTFLTTRTWHSSSRGSSSLLRYIFMACHAAINLKEEGTVDAFVHEKSQRFAANNNLQQTATISFFTFVYYWVSKSKVKLLIIRCCCHTYFGVMSRSNRVWRTSHSIALSLYIKMQLQSVISF